MKKIILILAVTLLFMGCESSKPMTGAEMKAAVEECRSNGFEPVFMCKPFSNTPDAISRITCKPKD